MNKKISKVVSLVLALVMCAAVLCACPDPGEDDYVYTDDGKNYTRNTYTTVSPSNWNMLSYIDNNDTQIMDYISSGFFGYDYKFDANGEIVPGDYTVTYEAATALKDVTAQYKDAWDLGGDAGYAWQITLRDDLKWENGESITAADFVYSLQQQLDPLFLHQRADSYYAGSTVIINAQNYVKQGQSGWFAASDAYSTYSDSMDSQLIFSLAHKSDKTPAQSYIRSWLEGQLGTSEFTAAQAASVLIGNFAAIGPNFTVEIAGEMEGKTLAEIKADPAMKAAWEGLIGWWQTDPGEELHFFVTEYTYPELDFSKVGIAVGETEFDIVVLLEKPLYLLKDDGSLSYRAAYNFSGLPLVHKATYEASKKAPIEGSTLWTSTYCTSKETTMSWGPFKLTSFQSGKQYVLERNTEWYAYNLEENEGYYLTDRIVCNNVKEWSTAWSLFLKGDIDGISIQPEIAADYKNSDRAYFTPDDQVGTLQLQSMVDKLAERSASEGVSHMLLASQNFRKALSLSINRADYTATCTTSNLPAFGIFNSMHYYDVENGGAYRETDEAKKVLCDVYGVNVDEYSSLDAAVNSITGYKIDLARELVNKAYDELLAAGTITATESFKITFGSGADNESVRRHYNYFVNTWTNLFVGTKLEGRVSFDFVDKGSKWASDFQAGAYDVCMGGWSGAAWDPGYFLAAYLTEDYMYSQGWDTSNQMMTFTMKGVAEDGGDITDTMSLVDWWNCLNGNEGCKYDWSDVALPNSLRLQLIAALEKEVLDAAYTVPTDNVFSASLISYKVDYISYEYNTFMAYGGLKYLKYNYTDEEWVDAVNAAGGELEY